MSDQTPNVMPDSTEQEPFIPPRYLLIIAAIAFLAALVIALTQPSFGVTGYGALAFGVLALIGWALMAPDQARMALSGRTARYGGLSVFVTVVLIIAMALVYVFVRNQNVRIDLTQGDDFSLTEQGEEAMRTLGSDPTLPPVKILAFYGVGQATRRDQDTLLFDDYQRASNGKVTYEFIDPNRNPQTAEQYGVTREGQIVVVGYTPEGEPDIENAERVNFFSQDDLTNAILKVSASGDFRAYIMDVEGGITTRPGDSGSIRFLVNAVTEQFDWTVQDVSFFDLTQPEPEVTLNDPGVDGEVMVIIGGDTPLPDQQLQVIEDYVNNGGSLIIFAAPSVNEDGESLASAENMATFLWETFGLRIRNDVVIDPVQAFQSPLLPVATDVSSTSFITSNGLNPSQTAVVFELPHSIEVSDTPPENVTVDTLIRSSESSYAKTDFQAVLDQNIERADDDLTGPLVLAASATNSETGGRVVVFGSTSLARDDYTLLQGAGNLPIAFNSLIWATDFNNFFQQTTMVSDPSAQDTPVFADSQTARNINFLTMILLPFGVLAFGIWILWNNRERERATR